MTRKDYIIVARAVRNATAMYGRTIPNFTPSDLVDKSVLIQKLCEEFLGDNPRFNAKKFHDACCG